MWTRILRASMVVSLQGTLLFALSATLMSCASRTVGATRSEHSEPGTARAVSGRPLGLDLYRPEPDDNPTVPARVALGRRLFQERRLSRDRSLTCVDCHRPERAFTDGRAKAIGVYGRRGARSVPTLVNRAWGESFFWDGRNLDPRGTGPQAHRKRIGDGHDGRRSRRAPARQEALSQAV